MDLYLTAAQAAEILGVDVRTLYTYVSRKKLRTLRRPGERLSRYWREDVERLARLERAPAAQSPLVSTTQVTLITAEGPYYRGHSAVELAEYSTIEEVGRILWQNDSAFGPLRPNLPAHYAEVAALVAEHETTRRAYVLLPLIEDENPWSFDFSVNGYVQTGTDVVRAFASIVVGRNEIGDGPLHQFIAKALGAPAGYDDLIRRMLILAADHELDPTTYAVRALANTGVSPYAIALTGMSAFRGRRLRVARAEQSIRLIDEILMAPQAAAPIVQRFRLGEAIPGFGGGVYDHGDPRADAMFRAFDTILGSDEDFVRLRTAASTVEELTGKRPDLILASAFLRHKLGSRRDSMSIAAVGRMVGWIAHAMEQIYEQPVVRPRAAYNGLLPGTVKRAQQE